MKYKIKNKLKYEKGDLVNFTGTQHYTTPNGKVFFTIKPGLAKVTAISKNGKHPYHLVAVDNSDSTVNGWVDETTIKDKYQEKKTKVVSLAGSKNVKICTAKQLDTGFSVLAMPWQNNNWTSVFRPKNSQEAEQLARMAESCCAKQRFDKMNFTSTVLLEVCTEAASLSIVEDINKQSLITSCLFNCFTSDDYTTKSEYLRRGDILLSNTNSAIVLSNGHKSNEQAKTFNPEEKKENRELVNKGIGFATVQENIKVFSGANDKFATIGEIKKGSKVEVLAIDINNWYRIVWTENILGYGYIDGENVIYSEKEKKKSSLETINALTLPESKDESISGSYKSITPLFMRADAGTQAPILIKLPKGIVVKNYGYYTEINNIKWLYVQAIYKNTIYNGYVSSNCFIDN